MLITTMSFYFPYDLKCGLWMIPSVPNTITWPGFTWGCQVHVTGLVVKCGISDTIVSEIPWFTTRPAICNQARDDGCVDVCFILFLFGVNCFLLCLVIPFRWIMFLSGGFYVWSHEYNIVLECTCLMLGCLMVCILHRMQISLNPSRDISPKDFPLPFKSWFCLYLDPNLVITVTADVLTLHEWHSAGWTNFILKKFL